jgi:hypothetical protein
MGIESIQNAIYYHETHSDTNLADNKTKSQNPVSLDAVVLDSENRPLESFFNASMANLFAENINVAYATTSHNVSWRVSDLERRMRLMTNDLSDLKRDKHDIGNRLDRLERNGYTNSLYVPQEEGAQIELAHHSRRRHRHPHHRPAPSHPRPHHPPAPSHPRPHHPPHVDPHYQYEGRVSSLETNVSWRGLDVLGLEGSFSQFDRRTRGLERNNVAGAFQQGANPVNHGVGLGVEFRLSQLENNMRRLEWRVDALKDLSRNLSTRLARIERQRTSFV